MDDSHQKRSDTLSFLLATTGVEFLTVWQQKCFRRRYRALLEKFEISTTESFASGIIHLLFPTDCRAMEALSKAA
jgi:hypothetical protein